MRSLVGTSWKMNLTSSEAGRYCEALRPLVSDVTTRDLFVLPPFAAIWAARQALEGSNVAWGAQHVHPEDAGAHTGDVSAPMLADLGCSYVEVGHSERRRDHGETDAFVTAQVNAVQRWGMTAIVCVGEREAGSLDGAVAAIRPQLAALSAADTARLIIAYEPAWAIGAGSQAAPPSWIARVHDAIRTELVAVFGEQPGVPVIYGGSVDEINAGGILAETSVDGLFVGRAALDPVTFARIAHLGPPS